MAPMSTPGAPRRYGYVGPEDIRRAALLDAGGGRVIRSAADLDAYVSDEGEPYTYVVGLDGLLRLAPRRSEHVACADGGDVLGAGEISLRRGPDGWEVLEISNQSTGYCPDPDSWPAVAAALDRLGVGRPDRFTHALVFRRCEHCGERNVVREAVFVCVFCDADLPHAWNLGAATQGSASDRRGPTPGQ
ncbi:hypothetical protein ACFU3O_15735 [Streptomyces antibioticus]|uniref:hypothetical protein n=1 Tax=Streptomyces antibioticus TaxID=1890 RepID=UPI00369E79A7